MLNLKLVKMAKFNLFAPGTDLSKIRAARGFDRKTEATPSAVTGVRETSNSSCRIIETTTDNFSVMDGELAAIGVLTHQIDESWECGVVNKRLVLRTVSTVPPTE